MHLHPMRVHRLVALMFQVFSVAVIQQQSVGVVFAYPLDLLHIKCALGLYSLTLPTSWNRDRETWAENTVIHN